MKLADFKRLKKFMMMTMSGADGEKLMAINRANALLVGEGVDWDRVLDRMVRLDLERAPPEPPKTDAEAINAAFADIEASDPRGSFADFIASLRDQWERTGSLSEKQRASLFDAAARVR